MFNRGIIDSVKLFLPREYFCYSPDAFPRSKKEASINRVTGEVFNKEKSYANAPGINLTVNYHGLIITLNPSTCVGRENNLILANRNELEYCIREVYRLLDKYEIKRCDGVGLRIRRLDIARNILCDYPLSFYKIVFDSLHFPRMHQETNGSSFSLKNGQREIVFYDKSEQLRKKKATIEQKNVIRCEIRFLNETEAKRNGFDSLESLILKYDNMEMIYDGWINNVLPEVNGIPETDIIERKLDLISKHGFKEAKKILLWAALIDVPEDQLKVALSETYSDSQTQNLLRERENYLPLCHGLLSNSGSQYYRLYNELRNKLLYCQWPSS